MALVAGTKTYQTVVTVVAASSGDGDLVAAMFNSVVIPRVSATAPTAVNASGTVPIVWGQSTILEQNQSVLDVVASLIAANTALTAPVTMTVANRVSVT